MASSLRGLIFDMDGTLYASSVLDRAYAQGFIQAVADRFEESRPAAARRFVAAEAHWAQKKKRTVSKYFVLESLGIGHERWAATYGRRLPIETALKPWPRLISGLQIASRHFRLGIVTNNHSGLTERTLATLGLGEIFDDVLTLTESKHLKPNSALYERMAEKLGLAPKNCLSLGDRHDLDLKPAKSIGMQISLTRGPKQVLEVLQALAIPRAKRLTLAQSQTAAGLAQIGTALNRDDLVVFPTETVYGLACRPTAQAVRWVYRAKQRPQHNPLVILLSHSRHAERFARIDTAALRLMKKYWPGELTMVLPRKARTAWGDILHSGDTVALRIPRHSAARAIIASAGGALVTTSANLSGKTPPVSAQGIDSEILAHAAFLVDEGGNLPGTPSTVIAQNHGRWKVLRQGRLELSEKSRHGGLT
jgi:tRNA threonylcarbamoyl adenosine modification protein (Sua5/YciO/YrdC/YwlC family)